VGGVVEVSAQADEEGQHTAPQLLSKAAAAGWRGAQEQSMPQETAGGDGADWGDRAREGGAQRRSEKRREKRWWW
jgi:hypothetical protein